MEARNSKISMGMAIISLLICLPLIKLVPYLYEGAVAWWKLAIFFTSLILLEGAYYMYFVRSKYAISVPMAVVGLVAILAFAFELPGYTRPRAAEMLRENVPGLESAALMGNQYEALTSVGKYIITFDDGDQCRNFIVDPDTLDYFEEDNVLLWYGENY
ncbi:MAG TPA: hypothetical protein IAB47_08370 [Candidatus Scatomorpha merdigallinarum]|nr:hypothetical protein [Candidatus Scatomorpha merdigallinarum]